MANAVEIEAKVLLDEKGYSQLLKKVSFDKSLVQTNWYIDSKDRVLTHASTRMGLRIRFVDGEYLLTLKAPMAEGLLEKEQLLSPGEAKAMIELDKFPEGSVKDFLELLDIDVSKLQTLVKLETERKHTQMGNFSVALDKNTYLNEMDYELEVDSDSLASAQKKAADILEDPKIEFTTMSKQSRALKAWEKTQK